jgi:hypothetical protein
MWSSCDSRSHTEQDVEKVVQLCSRGAQRLDVQNRVGLASSLAAAALEGSLFEHSARSYVVTRDIRTIGFRTVHNRFSTAC